MLPEILPAFVVTCLIIEITPGPNMAYLAALSLARGRRAGIAAVAGIALGLAISGAVAALGLAAVVEKSAVLYEALRWGGIMYLLYLAWEGWTPERDETRADEHGESPLPAFRRGLIINMLNPKAAIFYITVLPEFIRPSNSPIVFQTLTLSAIYVAIATLVHLSLVLLAGLLASKIDSAEKRQALRRALALALVAIAVWFAFATQRG